MSKNWKKFTTQAEISQKSKEKGGGGANFIFPLRPQLTAKAKKRLAVHSTTGTFEKQHH